MVVLICYLSRHYIRVAKLSKNLCGSVAQRIALGFVPFVRRALHNRRQTGRGLCRRSKTALANFANVTRCPTLAQDAAAPPDRPPREEISI
jgi:hypothetical protein